MEYSHKLLFTLLKDRNDFVIASSSWTNHREFLNRIFYSNPHSYFRIDLIASNMQNIILLNSMSLTVLDTLLHSKYN